MVCERMCIPYRTLMEGVREESLIGGIWADVLMDRIYERVC